MFLPRLMVNDYNQIYKWIESNFSYGDRLFLLKYSNWFNKEIYFGNSNENNLTVKLLNRKKRYVGLIGFMDLYCHCSNEKVINNQIINDGPVLPSHWLLSGENGVRYLEMIMTHELKINERIINELNRFKVTWEEMENCYQLINSQLIKHNTQLEYLK
jgi:hypothetical protein